MIGTASAIARKDLRLVLLRSGGLMQSLLLGLILIFVFSLSRGAGQLTTAQEGATIFWLSSLFCQVLIFHQLHSLENDNSARDGLITSPIPLQGIWLGKAFAGIAALFLAQCVFFPATIVFLGQTANDCWLAAASVLVADPGICLLGAFMGAIPGERESMLTVLLFPLLVPLLLAGISLMSAALGLPGAIDISMWLALGLAFDLIFFGAGLLLFGFFYKGGN